MGLTNFPFGVTSFGVPIYGNGIGPIGIGMGDIYYMVVAKTTANLFYQKLIANGISEGDIFTSLATAYAATTASQNDVIVATPGAYDETAELAWSNPYTHLVGLAGPNAMGDYYEPGVVIYTDTTQVANVINLTGHNSQFYNVAIQNAGNHAENIAALRLNAYGCYFGNVGLMGMMTANQDSEATAAALYIHTDGHTPIFDNCVIGQDVWGTRDAVNSGVVYFSGSQPNDGLFRNCIFKSISKTATCAMIAAPAANDVGRGWIFNNCTFHNFADDDTQMNQVFYGGAASAYPWPVILHNCMAQGYDRWTDNTDYHIYGNMPVADDGGGLAISLDETVAGGV